MFHKRYGYNQLDVCCELVPSNEKLERNTQKLFCNNCKK